MNDRTLSGSWRRWVRCLPLVALSGCGAVRVPETSFYRLALPDPEPAITAMVEAPRLGVTEVRLGADLASDRMMVMGSPVAVQFFHYHRWAGPLDRMLEDALVVGLARRRVFGELRRHALPGECDYTLAAQVYRFGIAADAASWSADALVDLRLTRPDGTVVFDREFSSRVPIDGHAPAAAALALSRAVEEIDFAFEECCRAHGVFGVDRPSAEPPDGRVPGLDAVPTARPPR